MGGVLLKGGGQTLANCVANVNVLTRVFMWMSVIFTKRQVCRFTVFA